MLSQPFTSAEIKEAIWDIDGGKAPGLDGFLEVPSTKVYVRILGMTFTMVFWISLTMESC